MAVLNLLRLARMTTARADFRESAEHALAAFAPRLSAAPVALPQMLAACEFCLSDPRQVILVGERGAEDTNALLRALYSRFLPEPYRAAGGFARRPAKLWPRAFPPWNPWRSWTGVRLRTFAAITPASCPFPRLAELAELLQ